MKKSIFLSLILLLLTLPSAAQVKIGYLSYEAALQSLPAYALAQSDLQRLREQYDAETKRSEEEFNAKYEQFLEQLSTLAPSIRRKRQAELLQMVESNVRFREEAQRLLRQAEENSIAPLQMQLDQLIREVATNHGYIVVLNTDNNSCPFIDPSLGEDITELIKEKLNTGN